MTSQGMALTFEVRGLEQLSTCWKSRPPYAWNQDPVLPEIEIALSEIETTLSEIETTLSEIETALPEIKTILPELKILSYELENKY